MGIRTGRVIRGPLRKVVRTVGVIDYAESGLADVTTKFKGWIEKLYVDTTGQQVHRGDPLFEIYSPELYSAQVEYLLSLQAATRSSETGDESLRASSRLKLTYWDISDDQIDELESTRKPKKTLPVLAPIDGFVVDKNVVEGQMVNAGMNIYRLADLGLVWVQAEIYEQDLPYLKLGQEAVVTLSYLPDRKFRGRVTYIYPYVDPKTRTVRVRMEFHNPGFFLKPGMFASVEIQAELAPSALLVPDSAVLRSGQKNTVFVALPEGKFDPRSVTLGPRAENDMYQVLNGLHDGERIVTSGQFMLDSESQLREAIQKMLEPGTAPQAEGKAAAGAAQRPPPVAGSEPGDEHPVWVCPMPEHVSIEYEHSGACPICGMTLVPVTKDALEKLQPGGTVLYYTCPMPEHSDVHEEKPGKCPECGMTLIPVMQQPGGSPGSDDPPGADTPETTTLYTCPMSSHAYVVSDQPGLCPDCEMNLVPTSTVDHGKAAEERWHRDHAE
jgi:RND family efflux transporter MFP subunit